MLNKRQRSMIEDLENTSVLITAQNLADKYKVSLRTVRNDIQEISEYAVKNGAEIIRIPGQGMRISAKKKLSSSFQKVLNQKDFPYLSEQERVALLLINFLFEKEAISASELAERFEVSRGTVNTTIKDVNTFLEAYHLSLQRFANKGYFLNGRIKDILRLCETLLRQYSDEVIYSTLSSKENNIIREDMQEKMSETMRFLSNNLLLYISHYHQLYCLLYCLISHSRNDARATYSKERLERNKLNQFILFLEDRFSVVFLKEGVSQCRHILSVTTDYSEDSGSEIEAVLPEAVDSLIRFVSNSGMYQIDDYDSLKIDLMVHLKSTIDARNTGLPRENPLLEEIRSSYPNEFQLVKSACQQFSRYFSFELDDNEAGYITLYFLRSFDKAEKIQDTNVMVVCNTGRSASKLLATRLINNLPNIHIVSMNSLFNIQNDPSILDNVDFIISTIPIPNIEKPHIVISPLLQKGELERVRESIWLSKNEKLPAASVDKAATTLVEPYLRYQDADQFLKGGFENALPYQTMTLLGEASMDLFDLISRLYPKGIPANKYSNVSGIFAHVLMSVPRWQRGEFIEPFDYENLSEQYPEECRIISEYLDTQSKKFSVFIPEAEMIAILRYYIY